MRQRIQELIVATAQAAKVISRPYRASRRMNVLESNNFDLNAVNEDLQEEIASRDRTIKYLKRDLNQAVAEVAKLKKDTSALKKFILVVNRMDIPAGRRVGPIDKLLARANEIESA